MPNLKKSVSKKDIFEKSSTLGDILKWGEQEFKKAKLYFGHGTDNAWDEAVFLALHVLQLPCDVDRSILKARLSLEKQRAIFYLFKRRIRERIPAAYLTNMAFFANLPFYVDERVLIPRSSIGELILRQFSPWIKPSKVQTILDLGTGSGALAIACAKAFPKAKVDAVENAEPALIVAAANIKLYGLAKRVKLINSDLFEKIKNKKYDLIVSNPPYVTAKEYKEMPREYHHEPKEALLSGKDGLDCVRQLLKTAPEHLNKGGVLVVEVGNREKELPKLFPHLPLIWPDFEQSEGGVFVLLAKE